MGSSCSCHKQKCSEKVSGEEEHIFHSFWGLGSHVSQNTYLIQSIKLLNNKRPTLRKNIQEREFSFEYHLKVNAAYVKICKKKNLSFHGLQNSRKRNENIKKQIQSGNVVAKADERDKHKNRPHAFPEEMLDIAREFINLIPKYGSHYSRIQNPNRQYLDCDLLIHCMNKNFFLGVNQKTNGRLVLIGLEDYLVKSSALNLTFLSQILVQNVAI